VTWSLRATIAAGVLVLLGVVAAALLLSPRAGPAATTPSPQATVAAATTPPPTPTPSPTAAAGTITGRLGYPGEVIPPLTVYAIRRDAEGYFAVDTPQYQAGAPPQPTYSITGVAPGTYVVLAYRNDGVQGSEERPGVYSQAVPCGLRAGCDDHSLIPVQVTAGAVVTGIDVTDWHYPVGQRYPPRPR
jgi:hypothetical protein